MRIAIATCVALLSTMAVAQSQPAGPSSPHAKTAEIVTAGKYVTDPLHTQVVWTVDHFGVSPYTGIIGDITGTLDLDPKNPTQAKVDITIPVSKIVTTSSAFTGHLLRDGKDGGKADFFGSKPADARFVSTEVKVQGQRALITGNLTLNGITKPVALAGIFHGATKAPPQMGGKLNVGFYATASIKRSDFGLGYAVPMVSDEVRLDISAAFVPAE